MKALTICNPYPYLIATGEKRVENRTWYPPAGLDRFVIHAGKSKEYMQGIDTTRYAHRLVWGSAIGFVELLGAVHLRQVKERSLPPAFEFLYTHKHAFGPVCWVLGRYWHFRTPIYRPGDA